MTRPNVVLFFVDNQNAGTLGCYGNTETYTPNIDRLAAGGLTFDNAFCPNAYCSPCRASVMTGKMPSQHGVHSWIDDRNAADWPAKWYALPGHRTLPEHLSAAGYRTALVGKYHLGDPTAPMPGFDHWVTMADGHVRSFWQNRIFDNGATYDHHGHSVDFFTGKAISFIEDCAGGRAPFFLYLPLPAPYGHWPSTQEPIRTRHSARYDDCPVASVPRLGLSPEAVRGYDLKKEHSGGGLDFSMLMRAPNDLGTLRNYFAQISMVDEGVGQVLQALERLGLSDDTLVIYTADHGLSLGHHGFWGHGGATYPSNLHRAAHSVPLILHHPGRTRPGSRSARMVSNLDLFATILDAAGVDAGGGGPSRSLRPLFGGDPLPGEDAVYAEQEETRVIRTPEWLYFRRFPGAAGMPPGDALYDLNADPDEARNLIDDPALAEVLAGLRARLDAFFGTYSRPEADLWTGGRPLQNSERVALWQAAWGPGWSPLYAYPQGAAAE
jgi:Arylsulfatase A and related enzymes